MVDAAADVVTVGRAAVVDATVVGAAVEVDAVVADAAEDVVDGIAEDVAVGVGAMVVVVLAEVGVVVAVEGGVVTGGTVPQLEASTETSTLLVPQTTLVLTARLPRKPVRILVARNWTISNISWLKLMADGGCCCCCVSGVDFRRRMYSTYTLPFLESRAERVGVIWVFVVHREGCSIGLNCT